jgi:hypothetical protein
LGGLAVVVGMVEAAGDELGAAGPELVREVDGDRFAVLEAEDADCGAFDLRAYGLASMPPSRRERAA